MAKRQHATRTATVVALVLIAALIALPATAFTEAERATTRGNGITTLVDLWEWFQGWIGKLGAQAEANGDLQELSANIEPDGDLQGLGAQAEPHG